MTFLREDLAPGATIATYVCRKNGEKFRCSKDMYRESEREAIIEFLVDCARARKSILKRIQEAEELLAVCDQWTEEAANRIKELS